MAEVRLINAFKIVAQSWRKHQTKGDELINAELRRVAFLDTVVQLVYPLVNFGANVYFFRLLLRSALSLDNFVFLRGLMESTVLATTAFAKAGNSLHRMAIDLQNFNEIYATQPTIEDGKVEIRSPLTIEFKEVSFSYPGADTMVLQDVSFKVIPGQKLALVGENGAGKTTIIKLILRQYLPTRGTITINGINIKDVQTASYHANLSNLTQEFLLVSHLSISDNLLIGLDDKLTDKQIYQATDSVGITELIKALPEQLETRLDASFENGTDLSNGQKQRLAIARTLLHNADMMILDEPTSAIDANTENFIFKNLYRAYTNKTILFIGHRFGAVRKADQIIVLQAGRIIESGSHQELLDNSNLYASMFENQAQAYQ